MKTQLPISKALLKTKAIMILNFKLVLILFTTLGYQQAGAQGTWSAVTATAPGLNGGVMMLLSDGSVICKSQSGGSDGYGNIFNKLTPNINGSYANGTWSSLPSMINTRLYFSSQILKDGRVYVAGGEYGSGLSAGETYNPLTNIWTANPSPGNTVSDANSEMLPDGRVMQALVAGNLKINTIYNPLTNNYSAAPSCLGIHNESAWIKLPDNSILFVDRLSTASERYIPATNTWVNDGVVPVALYDNFGLETGGAVLLPDGRAFFLGATGHTAYYTPSGTSSPGVWAAGPDIPSSKGTPDAPMAMMVNGKILCAVSPLPTSVNHFPSPTTFYEFNYLTNTYTSLTAPGGGASINDACYTSNMLDLPDGTVLYSRQGSAQYYIYTPTGAPLVSGKPTISNIAQNSCTSFSITGTQFNGISQGANYGDDWQMSTNYPLVRLTSGNNVYYCRTFNWNSTGVKRGILADTVQFTTPSGLPVGTYSLVVVANGIASDPVSFNPLPSLSSSLTPSSICTNTAFTYTPTSSIGSATFTWTRAAVSGISNAAITVPQVNNPNEVLVNTTSAPKSVVYAYTINAGGCSNTQNVTVIVNPLPVASVISAIGSTTFCAGGSVILNGNTTSGTWSNVGGTTSSLIATASGDYYVTNSNACGSINSNHIIVVVSPLPVVSFTGLAGSYFVTDPAAVLTGSPAGGNFTGAGMLGNSFTPSFAGVGGPYSIAYSYTNGSGCSNSTSQSTIVLSCTAPLQPGNISTIGGAAKVCSGDTKSYKITAVSSATSYTWTPPTGATISTGQGTLQITVNYNSGFVTGDTLRVTADNACGSSAQRKLRINRNVPTKPVSLTGVSTVCANQQGVPYSITPIANATNYTWVGPTGSRISDGLITSTTATLITTSAAVTINFKTTAGNVKVRSNNACGSSAYLLKPVTFNCREINEALFLENNFSVYPNPNDGNFIITFNSATSMQSTMKLINALGQEVYSEDWNLINGDNSKVVSMTDNIPSGIYFVVINTSAGAYRQKVVKQ